MPDVPTNREPQFTRAASRDLDEIEEYISQDNPRAADRVVRRIRDVCSTLAGNPFMGRSRQELVPELRSFPIGSYVIYYRPIDGNVQIMRIYHSSRDIDSLFR